MLVRVREAVDSELRVVGTLSNLVAHVSAAPDSGSHCMLTTIPFQFD